MKHYSIIYLFFLGEDNGLACSRNEEIKNKK